MTLMQTAKRTLTPEILELARNEKVNVERLQRNIASGKVVILEKNNALCGIGDGLRIKINANIGTAPEYINLREESEKIKAAVSAGTDTIMDLSIGGNVDAALRNTLKVSRVPVGTVPVYCAAVRAKSIEDVSEDEMLAAIEKHVNMGVDFLTIHAAITSRGARLAQKRVMKIVSRGGCILANWMNAHKKENPLYENYDYILEILKENDAIISIGDALRPGAIQDANDAAQISELKVQAELTKRAHANGVGVICEGPGHMPLHKIIENIKLQQKLCRGAPYYVLGPLVTDVAVGNDHICSAIGGAVAANAGASYLCVVTPSEHAALPAVEDVREGVVAAKIAAHAADVSRGIDLDWDLEMSKARWKLNWKKQFELALDSKKASEFRRRKGTASGACSMCGEFCAVKIMKKISKRAK